MGTGRKKECGPTVNLSIGKIRLKKEKCAACLYPVDICTTTKKFLPECMYFLTEPQVTRSHPERARIIMSECERELKRVETTTPRQGSNRLEGDQREMVGSHTPFPSPT